MGLWQLAAARRCTHFSRTVPLMGVQYVTRLIIIKIVAIAHTQRGRMLEYEAESETTSNGWADGCDGKGCL